MKKLIFLISLTLLTCSKEKIQHELLINGRAAIGWYISSDVFYIWFTIKNTGKHPLVFDRINKFWYVDPKDCFFSPEILKNGTSVIKPGQSREFHANSHGFNMELLEMSIENLDSVKFDFNLSLGDDIVAGNYYTILPFFHELPRYHQDIGLIGEEYYKLTFTQTIQKRFATKKSD